MATARSLRWRRLSTGALAQKFNMGKVNLFAAVSTNVRAIEMAVVAVDALAVEGLLA